MEMPDEEDVLKDMYASVGPKRPDPTTDELEAETGMVFVSDGSGTGEEGDLVYAVRDGDEVLTMVILEPGD